MYAAGNGHHAMVERLVAARADVNTKTNYNGRALPHRPVRRRRPSPTLPIAPSGRWTALHYAAHEGYTESAVALLVGGADQTVTDNDG